MLPEMNCHPLLVPAFVLIDPKSCMLFTARILGRIFWTIQIRLAPPSNNVEMTVLPTLEARLGAALGLRHWRRIM